MFKIINTLSAIAIGAGVCLISQDADAGKRWPRAKSFSPSVGAMRMVHTKPRITSRKRGRTHWMAVPQASKRVRALTNHRIKKPGNSNPVASKARKIKKVKQITRRNSTAPRNIDNGRFIDKPAFHVIMKQPKPVQKRNRNRLSHQHKAKNKGRTASIGAMTPMGGSLEVTTPPKNADRHGIGGRTVKRIVGSRSATQEINKFRYPVKWVKHVTVIFDPHGLITQAMLGTADTNPVVYFPSQKPKIGSNSAGQSHSGAATGGNWDTLDIGSVGGEPTTDEGKVGFDDFLSLSNNFGRVEIGHIDKWLQQPGGIDWILQSTFVEQVRAKIIQKPDYQPSQN